MMRNFLEGLRALAQLLANMPPDNPELLSLPTLSALVCLGDCRVTYDGALVPSVMIAAPDDAAFIHLEQNHLREIEQSVLADCPDAWVVMVSPGGLKLNFLIEKGVK